MHRLVTFGAALVAFAPGIAGADQLPAAPGATPAPTPSPASTPFAGGGYVRSIVAAQAPKSGAPIQNAYTFDLQLHFSYKFGASPFSAGAAYLDSVPLGSCSTPAPPLQSNCVNATDHATGFAQSSFPEAFVQYDDARLHVKAGNQTIATPWATSNTHSHIEPAAFQGGAVHYAFNPHVFVDAGDYVRFKPYDSPTFGRSTYLTGAGTLPPNIYNPSGQAIENNGYVYGRVGYAGGGRFAANAYYYGIQNIANILWMDASYPLGNSEFQPFVKMQAGSERNAGTAVVGQIDSTVVGLQSGINLTPVLALTIGFDGIPNRTATVRLPAGYSCPAAGSPGANVIAVNALEQASSLAYFLPTGGTGNCTSNANGTTNLHLGGWASPFTDSNATDPLFTTPLLQGMVDRRSPGSATSAQLTYTTLDKRLVSYVSETFFNYNNAAFSDVTHETDVDALYYFNRVRAGRYRGLFFRFRYGNLSQSGAPDSSAQGLTFDKFELEYDF